MKATIIFCLALMLTGTQACNKQTTVAEVTADTTLIGTWELRKEQNGMMPNVDHAAGNGTVLKFSASGYERYKNGTLEKTGTYSIVADTTVEQSTGLLVPEGQYAYRIVFDAENTTPKTFFEISGKKLSTLAGYFPTDGGSRKEYEKTDDPIR